MPYCIPSRKNAQGYKHHGATQVSCLPLRVTFDPVPSQLPVSLSMADPGKNNVSTFFPTMK